MRWNSRPERARDRAAERGLAGARRTHEAEDRTLEIALEREHGDVLDDAVLDLVEAEVIEVEDPARLFDVEPVLGHLRPGQVHHPLEIAADHRVLGGRGRHLRQPIELAPRLRLGLLGHAGGGDPLLEPLRPRSRRPPPLRAPGGSPPAAGAGRSRAATCRCRSGPSRGSRSRPSRRRARARSGRARAAGAGGRRAPRSAPACRRRRSRGSSPPGRRAWRGDRCWPPAPAARPTAAGSPRPAKRTAAPRCASAPADSTEARSPVSSSTRTRPRRKGSSAVNSVTSRARHALHEQPVGVVRELHHLGDPHQRCRRGRRRSGPGLPSTVPRTATHTSIRCGETQHLFDQLLASEASSPAAARAGAGRARCS